MLGTTSDLLNLCCSHFWQLTVLVIVVTLADRLLVKRWPALAAFLWLAVLIKALVPPLWASPLGLFSWTEAGLFPLRAAPSFVGSTALGATFAALVVAALIVWLVGCLVSLALVGYRWRRLRQEIDAHQILIDESLRTRIEDLARELSLPRCPRIVACDSHGPLVVGIFKTTLCVPSALLAQNDWPTLKPVLIHELVHIRRRDTLVSLIQLSATCVWWFNPLVRWASRRLTQVIEYSVDREVTSSYGCDSRQYAHALLRVMDLKHASAPVFGAGVSSSCVTGTRIKQVLRSRVNRRRPRTSLQVALLLAVLVVVLPGRPLSVFMPICSPSPHAERVAAAADPSPL